MNRFLLTCILSLVSSWAVAQTAAIKDIPADGAANTVISISKGTAGSTEKEFEIVSGNGDVSGDSSPLVKAAKESWKKACTEWKTEVKDLNKENSILALNCGSPNCKKEEHGSTCSSVGIYQLKVRIKK